MHRQLVARLLSWGRYVVLVGTGSVLLAVFVLNLILPSATDQPIQLSPTSQPVFDPNVALQQHRIRGEFQQALYLLETRAARTGWSAETHIVAGNLWRSMGDSSRALPHWEAAAQQNPTTDLLRQLAQFHIDDHAWRLAWERLQQLLAQSPNDAWGLHQAAMLIAPHDPSLARDYLLRTNSSRNRYSDTANRLLLTIGDQPQDPSIASRVGAILISEQQWSLAENAFRVATLRTYLDAEALAWVAYIRAQQGRDGADWMTAAITLAPADANVRYVEGLYARVLDDLEVSEGALLLAVALDPQNPVFYAELGNTYREMSNFTEAEYWLQTALQLSNNDTLVQDALDRFYANEAYLLPDALLALRNSPVAQAEESPLTRSAEGWALHLIGRSTEGLALVESALEEAPEEARIRYDYARILVEIGRLDDALELLNELAAGSSDYAESAQRLLGLLS